MTVLSAASSALMRLIKRNVNTVFSSNDPTVQEIANLVNEVATFIIKKHDWQALTKIATITGDGVTGTFPLPIDYDRMVLASSITDPQNWFWNYQNITDINQWLWIKNSHYLLVVPGAWMLLGNEFNFLPAPATGQSAQYAYVSDYFARSSTGAPKASFDQDSDTFVLDERLLTLGLIWMWKVQKSFDSGQAEADFMTALSENIARDKGARVIVGGGRASARFNNGSLGTAYPFRLGY